MTHLTQRGSLLAAGLLAAALIMLLQLMVVKASTQTQFDTFTVATVGDAPTMDPHMHSTRTGLNMQAQVIEHLVRRNQEGHLVGELATNWELIADTTWRFHLREGVIFHNGNDFTAEAVKFSLERIIDPEQRSPVAGNLRAIERIEVVDDHTVDIHTHYPSPTLPISLAAFAGIIDPLQVETEGEAALATNPVGTGPYRLVEWRRDDFARFERFEDHWGGPSHIRELIFRPIPDVNARVFALKGGEADVIQDVPAELVPQIKADPRLRISAVPSVRVHFVQLRPDVPPLDDVRVRQALNYAVNKQRIIDVLLNGYGRVLSQPVTAEFFGYNPDLDPYPYDPERARELLAEAGHPNGFTIEFHIFPAVRSIAEVIAADLRAVGVSVNFKISEFSVSAEDFANRAASPLHYMTWGAFSLFDADGTLPHVFREGARWSYYSHPRVDELAKIGATALDSDVREAAYHEAMEILREEAPWLYLWQQYELHATSYRAGWQGTPDNILRFYNYPQE